MESVVQSNTNKKLDVQQGVLAPFRTQVGVVLVVVVINEVLAHCLQSCVVNISEEFESSLQSSMEILRSWSDESGESGTENILIYSFCESYYIYTLRLIDTTKPKYTAHCITTQNTEQRIHREQCIQR